MSKTQTAARVAWVFIVAIVIYLVVRRFRRSRSLSAQARRHGTRLKKQKRLLTEEEIQQLPIATLTHDDIKAAKSIAAKAAVSLPAQVVAKDRSVKNHVLPVAASNSPHLDGLAGSSPTVTLPEPIALPQQKAHLPANANTSPHSSTDCQQQEQAQPAAAAAAAAPPILPALLHEENCAICLEDFAHHDKVRQLPCRHYFHIDCIDPWLSNSSATCPLCNYDVATEFDESAGQQTV